MPARNEFQLLSRDRPLEYRKYRTRFTLAPGDYAIRLVAMGAHLGTYWLNFTVPARAQ